MDPRDRPEGPQTTHRESAHREASERSAPKFGPLERDDRSDPPLPRWILPVVAITTLTIGGWYIIQNLAATSKMEDCTMSGRHNCVPPIDTASMAK